MLWLQLVAKWTVRELSSSKGMRGHCLSYSHRISLPCNMPKFILVKDNFFFPPWTLTFYIVVKFVSQSALNENFSDLVKFSQKIRSKPGNQTCIFPSQFIFFPTSQISVSCTVKKEGKLTCSFLVGDFSLYSNLFHFFSKLIYLIIFLLAPPGDYF